MGQLVITTPWVKKLTCPSGEKTVKAVHDELDQKDRSKGRTSVI
jgi:hypothetical protein